MLVVYSCHSEGIQAKIKDWYPDILKDHQVQKQEP